jgi:hypothetical protein
MGTFQILQWAYQALTIMDLAIIANVIAPIVIIYLMLWNIAKTIDINAIKDHNFLRIGFAEISKIVNSKVRKMVYL